MRRPQCLVGAFPQTTRFDRRFVVWRRSGVLLLSEFQPAKANSGIRSEHRWESGRRLEEKTEVGNGGSGWAYPLAVVRKDSMSMWLMQVSESVIQDWGNVVDVTLRI